MLQVPPPNPRKRQRSESPEQTRASQPPSKKQSLHHPSLYQHPPAFWDNLSKIWLTKLALRELDRRNREAASSPSRSPHRRAHRPVTRKYIADQRNGQVSHCTDYLRRCTPKTLKDIRLFARHGGPDLSDIRNYPESNRIFHHVMSSADSARTRQRTSQAAPSTEPTTNTTRTRSSGVYDRNFLQNLVDNGVYPHAHIHLDDRVPAKPENWEDIQQMLTLPRRSLSPSRFTDEDYYQFVKTDANASKEKQVSELVIPIIEGKIKNTKCRSGGIPFTNLDPLIEGMPLKPGNPDVYYGARPEQLNPTVRNELGGHVMPSTQHDLPMVPIFFLATKGQDGTLAVAGRQACYDGALGARGIHTLRSYQQEEPLYDNNAYAITSIYHGGGLKMFTSHVAPSPSTGGRPEYHMNQLRWFAMTDTADAFRQGAGAYRNARDWAEQQRNEAIMRANEKAKEKANEQANEEVDEEANTVEASTPTGDAPPSPAISFVTAVSETEAHTVTQESRTSVDEVSGGLNEVSGNLDESDGSEDLTVHIIPAKRPNKRSKQAQTRKRRIVDTTAEQSETVVDGKR